MDVTYVALKRLRVAGEYRNVGDLVPEAAGWRNVSSYLNTGHITAVPKSQVDSDALAEAENRSEEQAQANRDAAGAPKAGSAPEGDDSPPVQDTSEGSDRDETADTTGEARDYDDLNADEVRAEVEAGNITPDAALEHELNRPKPRKGVLDFLESLDDEE